MWRNLDLAMWSGNQDEVGGPAVSGWVHTPQTQKITQYTEHTGRPFLCKIGPCRRHCSWGSTHGPSLRTGTSTTVSRMSSTFCVNAAYRLHSVAFSSSWQCQGAHNGNSGLLSQWERGAAATAHTVLTRPLSPWLLPIHRNEGTTEGYPVQVLI